MGALKRLKKKLSASSKKFMNNENSNTKSVLGDVTNASPGKSNKRGKTLKPFRTADVSSATRSNVGGVSLKAVEIFEDDEAFEREGGSKAPPPSSASDSVSPASSKSSKCALDQWADHLILPVLLPVGEFNENKEEEKEQPKTPTKTTDDDKDDEEEVIAVTDAKIFKRLSKLAKKAFNALGGKSLGRIDIKMNNKGIPHFMEANLMPGLRKGYFYRSCLLNLNMTYEDMIFNIANTGLSSN